MKIRIQGQPEFLLPLTLDEVEMIRKVSAKHYDFVCREASYEGATERGFLTSWRNILRSYIDYPPDDPDFVPAVSATWRQIDTTLKILEPCNLFVLADVEKMVAGRLSHDLRAALREAGELYGKWSAEINTETSMHAPTY